MSDLVIQEKDGWIEISDLVAELDPNLHKELWDYAAKHDIENARDLLDMELGGPLQEKIGTAQIVGLRVLSMPDDILGEKLRVWIKVEGKGRRRG